MRKAECGMRNVRPRNRQIAEYALSRVGFRAALHSTCCRADCGMKYEEYNNRGEGGLKIFSRWTPFLQL